MKADNRKSLILGALRAFINQRSGIEFGNYGDVKAFRAEQRGIQKDRRQALELLRAVELSSEIGADELIKAARSAYSGRLTITLTPMHSKSQQVAYETSKARGAVAEMPPPDTDRVTIDYCTGQYFVTEYRRAACAVLASALWEYTREHCMPAVGGYRIESWAKLELHGKRVRHAIVANREAAERQLRDFGGSDYGSVVELYPHNGVERLPLPAGDWLRAQFLRQFGRGIASRWFT